MKNWGKTTFHSQTMWSFLMMSANSSYTSAAVTVVSGEHIKASLFPLALYVQSANYYLQHLNSTIAGCTVTVPVISKAAAWSHQNSQVLPRKQSTGCNIKYTVNALDILYTHWVSVQSHTQWLILWNMDRQMEYLLYCWTSETYQISNKQHLR